MSLSHYTLNFTVPLHFSFYFTVPLHFTLHCPATLSTLLSNYTSYLTAHYTLYFTVWSVPLHFSLHITVLLHFTYHHPTALYTSPSQFTSSTLLSNDTLYRSTLSASLHFLLPCPSGDSCHGKFTLTSPLQEKSTVTDCNHPA